MNDARFNALAQDIYIARHNEQNDADGADLTSFLTQTMSWVNQLIPEVEKKADWNFLRTNDDTSIGTVTSGTTISYQLPSSIRKLVINPHRDLTIQQDGTPVSHFRLVNPNQGYDPSVYDTRSRATVVNRTIIFSRSLTDVEVGGTIVADTIAYFPTVTATDASLLDIFESYPDIRQLFVYGVLKNQILPDIVQGGLYPAYAQKFDAFLSECVAENNLSADADDQDRENFGWIGGV